MALCAAAQGAVFLHVLLNDLNFPQCNPTVIYEDNQSCIHISRNKVTNRRTKHIDIRYNFAREKIENGEIKVEYCNTSVMLADILTKPLPRHQHIQLCKSTFQSITHILSSGGVENQAATG